MPTPLPPEARDHIKTELYRKLSRKLGQLGLWMETDRFRVFADAQQCLGEKLLHETLPASGIRIDLTGLDTSSGRSLQKFCIGLPRILSFGYEISFGLYRFMRHSPDMHTIPRGAILGATFNGGISMFDRICDKRARATDELSSLFDGPLLMSLGTEPGTPMELSNRAKCARDPGVRMLLKLIADFFATLEIITRESPDSAPRKELHKLMIRAYSAQIRCSVNGGPLPELQALLAACEEKSTLPFHIMQHLICVCDGDTDGEDLRAADKLVRQIAKSFWLFDDLVDLVADFRSGDANVILLRAKAASSNLCEKTDCEIDDFPTETMVDAVVEEACSNLLAAVETVENSGQSKFAGNILTYVRRWLNSLSRRA